MIGGLAVPFFVLVMAFIGGAVSLSRRIPEYQRRLHPNYIPTDKECRMRPFEAREVVVFQIMQLISAPFLAVATWFIVSPMSLTAAATLAFGTGFASEPLLLHKLELPRQRAAVAQHHDAMLAVGVIVAAVGQASAYRPATCTTSTAPATTESETDSLPNPNCWYQAP